MDSKVFELIDNEVKRQNENIELIASENFVSDNVLRAVGSVLTNKYAEGYPGHRYYGGCQEVDKIEEYCKAQWQKVFRTTYHVNVQPHCGSSANYAAYAAVMKPGQTVLSMSLNDGGHLTHSASVSFVGKIYHVETYGLTPAGYIDYDNIEQKLYECNPRVLMIGASAYPRQLSFSRIKSIVDNYNANRNDEDKVIYIVDMAHIAGLIAAGDHPSPFGLADIITTTTHKTLRGPRGGLIFCKEEFAKKVDSAVFPGCQGGPLLHVIAGKAVAAEEDQTQEYHQYIHQVVNNCAAMAKEFKRLGCDIVTGGTDNHLLLLDLSKSHPHVTGIMAQNKLDEYGITLNKNMIPGDLRKPNEASGLRIGTAAMTTKGWMEKDFVQIADYIYTILNDLENERKQ